MSPEDEERRLPRERTIPGERGRGKDADAKSGIKAVNVKSLADYYRLSKLPAQRFLSAMKKNNIGKLRDDDVQFCLASLDRSDPEFGKTLDLLFRSANVRSSLAQQCVTFASRACRQQLSRHYQINLDLNKPANDLFVEVFHRLKPALTGKRTDDRSANLLKAVAIWESHSRNLDEVEAVGFLAKQLLSKRAHSDGEIPAAFQVLFKPATKIKTMGDMLRVAERTLLKAERARASEIQERDERERAFRRSQDYLNQIREANSKLGEKDDEIAGLRARLEASEDEKASLQKKMEHQKAISAHEEGDLKGRFRVFLERKLRPLLETAHEFAELDPPRKSIIVERLEIAEEEIRRETEWLKSTD